MAGRDLFQLQMPQALPDTLVEESVMSHGSGLQLLLSVVGEPLLRELIQTDVPAPDATLAALILKADSNFVQLDLDCPLRHSGIGSPGHAFLDLFPVHVIAK